MSRARPASPAAPHADHRPRVNAERRARMRRRLIEAALGVIAEQGMEASRIDDVMQAAGVSRGGFYGHFRSLAELQVAIGEALSNELVQLIEQRLAGIAAPAARMAAGLALYLQVAQACPMFARFIAAAGSRVDGPGNLIRQTLPQRIADGVERGQFVDLGAAAALDLVTGAMLIAITRVAQGQADAAYRAGIVAGILMGLGVPRAKAQALAELALPPLALPADSLLQRARAAAACEPFTT